MVWGMALPCDFGNFFPSGDFVGWKEALTEYYNSTMPAEQRITFGDPPSSSSYIYWASQNLKNESGTRQSSSYPPFRPIAAREAPKRFETRKSYASLGSLIELKSMIIAVDGLLKEIIENFETGIHQFFPIDIVMPKNVVYQKPYFIMAIGQYIDSISLEQSDANSWRYSSSRDYYFFEERHSLMSALALYRKKFGNAHLWRERRMLNHLICFSDRLMSEINRRGLRLPKYCQLREV